MVFIFRMLVHNRSGGHRVSADCGYIRSEQTSRKIYAECVHDSSSSVESIVCVNGLVHASAQKIAALCLLHASKSFHSLPFSSRSWLVSGADNFGRRDRGLL